MKNTFHNLSKSAQYVILSLAILLNIIFVPQLLTSCKSNSENILDKLRKANQQHVDSIMKGLKKTHELTLAEIISVNIIKNEDDWADSTDLDMYDNLFLWSKCERWKNNKCNIKLQFRIYEAQYKTELIKYEGYITVISQQDTTEITEYEFQKLAPVLDTILIRKAINLQEIQEKNRLDSIMRMKKIKEDRILKNFCK